MAYVAPPLNERSVYVSQQAIAPPDSFVSDYVSARSVRSPAGGAGHPGFTTTLIEYYDQRSIDT